MRGRHIVSLLRTTARPVGEKAARAHPRSALFPIGTGHDALGLLLNLSEMFPPLKALGVDLINPSTSF